MDEQTEGLQEFLDGIFHSFPYLHIIAVNEEIKRRDNTILLLEIKTLYK